MIALPSWFTRPKGKKTTTLPTSADLAEQLQQADADVAEVEARETAAAEREASERTPEAVEAFESVRVEADRLRRFRERLRADLEAARGREAEQLRAQQIARVTELRELVARPAVMAVTQSLIDREVDVIRQLVEVRIERQALRRKLGRLADEGQSLAQGLELKRLDDHTSLADNPVLVAEALLAHVATLEVSDPRRGMLHSIARELSPSARASMPTDDRMVPRSTTTEAQA